MSFRAGKCRPIGRGGNFTRQPPSRLTLSFLTGRRRWRLMPIVVQSLFLQHALQGWCPPMPKLLRLGVRTREEIERERYAMKVLRGDFRAANDPDGAHSPEGLERLLGAIDR